VRIHRYLFRELVVASCFTVGGMLVLALPAVAVTAISKLPGVDLRSVLLYLPLVLAGLVPYVLPLGYLLAVVSTYARLAADNEWTAIRMTGMSPWRILMPGALLGLALSGLTWWMNAELLPDIRRQQSRYLVEATSETVRLLSPGRTDFKLGDFYLTARRRDGQAFVDAQVYLPAMGGEPARNLRADRIEFRFEPESVLLLFRNARTVSGGVEFENGDMTVRIDLAELQSGGQSSFRQVRYKTSAQIRADLRSGEAGDRARELRFELHYRPAMAAAFAVFLLLGAPTGLLLRRGNQLPALAAGAGYALAFYLLHMRLGKQLADKGVFPPEPCAWASIAIGLVAGGLLCWRAFRR
jgi:lipopolysaccharide export system permease protein